MGGASLTIVYYVGGKIVGLSSDVKPTSVPENTTFIESDTFTEFIFDGTTTWNPIGGVPPNMDDTDLQAYYTFEETIGDLLNHSLSVDSVGVNGEGVNTGLVGQTNTGIIGNAYDYTGGKTTLGTILSTFNEPLSATAKWTMILWLNPTTHAANDIVFDNQNASSSFAGMRLRFQSSGAFTLVGSTDGGQSVFNSGVTSLTFGTGSWQMLAITFDFSLGSDNLKLSINDGTKEASNTGILGTGEDPGFNLTLGEAALGNDEPYDGLMDEVSIWKRVLTDAEITALYNGGVGLPIYGDLPPFSPLNVAGLVMWFDADDLGTITKDGSDFVSQWDDKSSSSVNLASSGSQNPLWVDGVQNGKPVIRFDGSDDFLENLVSPTWTQPNTLFIVTTTGSTDTDGIWDGGTPNRNLLNRQGTNTYRVFAGAGALGGTANTNMQIFRALFNNTQSELDLDGVPIFTGQNADSQSMKNPIVGAVDSSGHTGFANIDVCEILFYNAALSEDDKTALLNYLNDKWAVF